jgi:uracil-DNA glycosylase
MTLYERIGDWSKLEVFHSDYFKATGMYIAEQREKETVYPEREDVFKAFELTPFRKVKVVLLGQDPYHDGNATGLAFECGRKPSPSWRKILEEYKLEFPVRFEADLEYGRGLDRWATQGVLLLNTALTVRKGEPGSHTEPWKQFTREIMKALIEDKSPKVFLLWGKYAQTYVPAIKPPHTYFKAEHPAAAVYGQRPWNAEAPFRTANAFLRSVGLTEIQW